MHPRRSMANERGALSGRLLMVRMAKHRVRCERGSDGGWVSVGEGVIDSKDTGGWVREWCEARGSDRLWRGGDELLLEHLVEASLLLELEDASAHAGLELLARRELGCLVGLAHGTEALLLVGGGHGLEGGELPAQLQRVLAPSDSRERAKWRKRVAQPTRVLSDTSKTSSSLCTTRPPMMLSSTSVLMTTVLPGDWRVTMSLINDTWLAGSGYSIVE